jgi:hypothetical protein
LLVQLAYARNAVPSDWSGAGDVSQRAFHDRGLNQRAVGHWDGEQAARKNQRPDLEERAI